MMFKAQLESEMDGVLVKQVDCLRDACKAVHESKELQALFQVVLSVGNALNAGTGKGNAVGFKLSALLKLSELKSSDKQDKKTTLLHFVVEVVHQSAPGIVRICEQQKAVRDATRVSLDELNAKKLEAERGLTQVAAGSAQFVARPEAFACANYGSVQGSFERPGNCEQVDDLTLFAYPADAHTEAAPEAGPGGAGAVSAASSSRAFGESRPPICWRPAANISISSSWAGVPAMSHRIWQRR